MHRHLTLTISTMENKDRNKESLNNPNGSFWICRLILFALLCGSIHTGLSQSMTSSLIGQNYWMASFSYGGALENMWDQVSDMKPEIIRVGGAYYKDNYIGLTEYDKLLNAIESAGAEPLLQICATWSTAQRNELLSHLVSSGRNIKYFLVGNEPDIGGIGINVNTVISEFITIATAIRTYFPDAIIGGPSYANFWGNATTGAIGTLYIPFIDGTKNAKDGNNKYLLNYFDFHTYNTSFNDAGVAQFDLSIFIAKFGPVQTKINEVNVTRPSGEKLSWSVSEFNITYNNSQINCGGTLYTVPATHKTWSFYAGQYFSQMYAYGMQNGAFGMMPWAIHESGGARSNGDFRWCRSLYSTLNILPYTNVNGEFKN
jgi:hypothetical protein